jgi:hypothetical protein
MGESDSPDIFEPKNQRQKLFGLTIIEIFRRAGNHFI